MRQVTVYTRRGCHLCERVEGLVRAGRRSAEFALQFVDVDSDDALQSVYGERVPVVAIDGQELFGYAMELDAFLKKVSL